MLRFKLGDFSKIKVPAKHAARIGQCFSTTVATVGVTQGREWRRGAPDVERNGFSFSDGVGTVSPKLARRIWTAYCEAAKCFRDEIAFPSSFFGSGGEGGGGSPEAAVPPVPSAFQIRLGGCKGMVSLDVRKAEKEVIMTRKSMDKFDAGSVRFASLHPRLIALPLRPCMLLSRCPSIHS